MNPWQIAWRNLKRRKLRSLLTIMAIVIGVASTFAVIAAVDTANKTFPIYLAKAFGKADYQVFGTDVYFSEDTYKELSQLENTASVALIKDNAKLHWEDEEISAIQKRVVVSGYSDMDTPLTDFELIEGDLNGGGAVITDRTAKVWDKGVGDTISFDTDEGLRSIEITAVVGYTMELMGPGGWMMAKYHPWSVAMPLATAQEWFGHAGQINNVQIKALNPAEVEHVGEHLDKLAASLEGIYTQPVVLDFETQFDTVDSFFMALYIAGLLGIALSAFIIFNSLYVTIKERKNEFAALKTIGFTPEKIQSMVLFEVLLMAIIGTLAGLVIGYGLGFVLKTLIYMVFSVNESGGMVLIKGLVISVLAGLLVPVIAAYYPIRQAGKVSVIEVLKGSQAATAPRRLWLVAVGVLLIISGFFINHLLLVLPLMIGVVLIFPNLFDAVTTLLKPVFKAIFGFSGVLAVQNLKRNLGRSSMTSVVLCLGIAMIVLMSSLNSALLQTYERIIYSSYGGNLDMMFHHMEKDDLDRIRNTDGVADAETYSLFSAVWKLDGKKRRLPVFGVGEDWIDRFPLFAASEGKKHSEMISQLQENEIILDRISYASWGGQLGESLTLQTLDGPQDFKVVAVVDTMKNSGYGSFMSEEEFDESFGLKYERNALVIKDENTSPLQLRENLFDQFGERVEEMFGPEDWVSVITATYTGSFAVINALIILSIAISGIGITNTLLMNIMERVREIGMMRAVGVTRKQIVRMIMLEGLGIGLTATAVGMLIGVLLVYITSTFLVVNSLSYEFGVPTLILVITGAFGVVISLISSFTPAKRAAKTKLNEALRYE